MARAGRTEEGICYRWWSEAQQYQLAPQAQPQIEISDLNSLVMDLAKWGVQARLELDWVTPPNRKPLASNRWILLTKLSALAPNEALQLTPLGKHMSELGIEPRLARLLIEGIKRGNGQAAGSVCAILSEGDPFTQHNSCLSDRLAMANGTLSINSKRPKTSLSKARQQWLQRSQNIFIQQKFTRKDSNDIAPLLISAFADRICSTSQSRLTKRVRYKLTNGRMASLDVQDPSAQEPWLIALDIGGHHGQEEDRIFLAHPIQLDTIETDFPYLIETKQHLTWSKKDARLLSELQRWIGKLCIDKQKSNKPSEADICQAIFVYIRQNSLSVLPWDDASEQLRARIQFAFTHDKNTQWPDYSDDALLAGLEKLVGAIRRSHYNATSDEQTSFGEYSA